MKRLLIYTFLTLTCLVISAQNPRIRNFSTRLFDGGMQTWDIAPGPANRVLFGNNQALLIYDGDRWVKDFVPNYTTVRSVFYDQKIRRVYVGASDEMGYFAFNATTHRAEYHSIIDRLPKENRSFGEIWKIFSRGNDIIFQSKEKLFLMSNDRDMLKVYSNNSRIECATYIYGKVITAGKDGIGSLRSSGGISPLPGTDILKGKVVRAILPYQRQILFVTSDDGIFAYDGNDTKPYMLPASGYLTENQVFCADIDGDVVAFGTVRGGLVVYNLRTGHTEYANILTGLQNNTVLSVMFDNNNNIWAGLDNGISYILQGASFRSLFGDSNQIGAGYTASIVGNQLYLGTNQGLFLTQLPLTTTPNPQKPLLLPGMTGQVWTLDTIGGMLLCGNDKGAYVIRGNTSEKIAGAEGTWKFVQLSKQPDRILASDYLGLLVLERRGNTYAVRNRIKGMKITSGNILVDDDGTIWICHWQKGVYHLWLNKEQTAVEHEEYFHKDKGLLMDEGNQLCRIANRIYVSCVDGFYYYDKATKSLVHDDEKNKIFNEFGVSLHIFENPNGDLWAYKPKYLAHATLQKDGSYKLVKQSFKKAALEMNLGAGQMCFIDEQNIICSSNNGFFVLNGNYADKTPDSKPFIRAIISTNEGDSVIYTYMEEKEATHNMRIPHSLNSIRIEFVMPEYKSENAVIYSCMLEGYDKEWSTEQYATSKEYTQLSKGSYTFHVRATNLISGKTDEAVIDIEILPAWYETWWAYIIYLLLAAVSAYYIYKYTKQRIDSEKERIKAEKERQLKEQQTRFSLEQSEKEKELISLRNRQMEIDMKQKSSELADSTMNLVRKNDLLQVIDEDIQELAESVRKEDPKTKIIRKINDIRHDIQSNMNDDANWSKFEENFNLVYDNFMQELIAHYPDLKKNDRKLCAYLRMGLSSKEMASLLNTSVRSIETARYRLRKKLNLDNGANLSDFIQKLGGTTTALPSPRSVRD